MSTIEFALRWGHFLAGITWIGILYYFNFIQGEYFKVAEGSSKSDAVMKLVPNALWWFRWGAMFTFLTGVGIIGIKAHTAGAAILATSWGIFILTGALMGTFMFLNVWLVIWPAQKVVIASTNAVAKGGQADPNAAACGAKAGLASRTNTLFSIPLLFFMGAASHLPKTVSTESLTPVTLAILVIVCGIEANALFGKPGPIASVKGVITSGFVLTAILYGTITCLI